MVKIAHPQFVDVGIKLSSDPFQGLLTSQGIQVFIRKLEDRFNDDPQAINQGHAPKHLHAGALAAQKVVHVVLKPSRQQHVDHGHGNHPADSQQQLAFVVPDEPP